MAKRVLWGAGGGFKGAFDVPILFGLALGSYDEMGGTSVFAVNGACAATRQLPVMDDLWSGLDSKRAWDGVEGFLDAVWWKWALLQVCPWLSLAGLVEPNSLLSMDPLEALVNEHMSTDKLVTPMSFGLVPRETKTHVTMRFERGDNDALFRKALMASASIAFIMNPHKLQIDDRTLLCSDGGHRSVLPYLPFNLVEGDEVDAIVHFTWEEEEEPSSEVDGFFESLEWFLEVQFAAQRETAKVFLRGLVDCGVKVRVFAPRKPLGGLLTADRDTIDWRKEEGLWSLRNPIKLTI